MAKTYEQIEKEKQKRIEEAIKNKTMRQSKTEISIGLRWAINCAVAFLPEEMRGTKKGFEMVEKWYQEFMELDRNYMLENMPIEPVKVTKEDYVVAVKEAPGQQARQDLADTLEEAKFKEQEQRANEETFNLVNQQL